MRQLLHRIKGSALQFALLIATVVIFMLLAFILLTNTNSFFRAQSSFLFQAFEKADRGIEVSLQENQRIDTIAAFQDKTIKIETQFLGGYELITSTGKQNSKTYTKKALIGATNLKEEKALVLVDHKKPLVFVGNSKINGTAYLPEGGLKTGVISGTYFNGDEMVKGRIRASTSQLPSLKTGFKKHIENLLSSKKTEKAISSWKAKEQNSFFSSEKIFFTEGKVQLYEELTGNIIVKSTSEIVIHKEAQLTDVTLVAPIIRIKEGFKGRIHAVASDSIIIEGKAKVLYPSSLVVLNRSISEEKKPAIVLEDKSVFEGTIIYLNNNQERKTETDVLIEKEATVRGQVYCKGFLELKGTVKGTVYTDNFVVKASGSRYLNHILDGRIDASDESMQYVGLPFNKYSKSVVQWLY